MKTKSKGKFTQEKNGTWKIDTKVKVGNDYKHFTKRGYRTLKDAQNDFERAKEVFIKSSSSNYKSCLMNELFAEYEEFRTVIVDISTCEQDRYCYKKYFAPFFNNQLIKDCLNIDSITNWYNAIAKSNQLSANKKSKVITRMKDILKYAYQHKFIDAPTYQDCDVILYRVKDSKKTTREKIVWNQNDILAFLSVIPKETEDYIMFNLFISLGARLGEFLGISVDSINFNTQKITIKQQCKYISGKGCFTTTRLKTHDSYRQILIDIDTCNLLKEYIEDLGLKGNDLLFTISRTNFRKKLYDYCELSGVPKIVPHGIRHTNATLLSKACKNANDIEAAAKRLGHSPEMFMNTYARHNTDETEMSLLEQLNWGKNLA